MKYFHIYNRGAHKAQIFHEGGDYERMLKLLYIANCSQPFLLRDFENKNVFEYERKDILVNITAYCLMPNHVHLKLEEDDQVSHLRITKFMRKLCTAYSQYYNLKYDHSGTIWQGSFKEKSSGDERYSDIITSYIHLNPYGIEEPEMTKEAKFENIAEAVKCAENYEYSSMKDYLGENRKQSTIINRRDRGVTSVSPVEPSANYRGETSAKDKDKDKEPVNPENITKSPYEPPDESRQPPENG